MTLMVLQVKSCEHLVENLKISVAMQLTVADVWLDHARKRAVGVQTKTAVQPSCNVYSSLLKTEHGTIVTCGVQSPPQPPHPPQSPLLLLLRVEMGERGEGELQQAQQEVRMEVQNF